MVPRTIYRTWMNATLPPPFVRAWRHTRRSNPGFRQVLFTDADMDRFMHANYAWHPVWGGEAYDAFYRINPLYGSARADFFRYLLLYEKGGVYLDAKSAAGRILSTLRPTDRFLVSPWPAHSVVRLWSSLHLRQLRGEFQQWWMAAAPRHPALRLVIDRTISSIRSYRARGSRADCDRAVSWTGESLVLYLLPFCKGVDVLWTTGPFVFTRAVEETVATAHGGLGLRVLPPNGNGTFVYDLSGNHRDFGTTKYWANGAELVLPTSHPPEVVRHPLLSRAHGP